MGDDREKGTYFSVKIHIHSYAEMPDHLQVPWKSNSGFRIHPYCWGCVEDGGAVRGVVSPGVHDGA